jgi:hypothetical protein
LYEINNAGTATARGTLSTTTGRVDMATDGDVILIVDGTKGYTYTIATTTLMPLLPTPISRTVLRRAPGRMGTSS